MDFLTEYNEAEVMAYLREEAIEMGREKGIAEGREDMIQKFTAFFMQENPSLSREAALERVRAIAE